MDNTNLHILNEAFNQMSDLSVLFQVVEEDFIFLQANQSAYNAGFKPEFIGMTVEDALSPSIAGPLKNLLYRTYTSKEYVRFNETLSLRDGMRLGDIALTPLLDENKKCTHIVGIARDITETKKWEEELVQNKSFYDTILYSTTDAILVTNNEHVVLQVNSGFTSLFGWQEHEIIGLPSSQLLFIPEENRKEHEEIAIGLKQGTSFHSIRTFRKHKEGKRIPVHVSFSPLKGKKGDVLGSITIYRDISAQIEVENILESEIQRYQSLVNNHPDAVFQIDTEGNFIDANHAVEAVTGYRVEDILEKSFIPLIAEDYVESILEHLNANLQGETRKYETVIINKLGERVDLDITAVPVIVNNKLIGIFGIARNITEQKKLAEELTQIKETLESFINNTSDAINITDLDARVKYINPAFKKIYGYTEEEILEKDISIISANKNLIIEELVQKMVKGESLHDMEVVHRHKNGSLIDISFSLSPIRKENGEVHLIATISRNITGKKEVQRRLKESEERNRLITENMTDLIAILDPNTVVLYASPSHESVLGLSLKVGKPIGTTTIHEDHIAHIYKKFMEVVETKSQVSIEFQTQPQLDRYVWLETKLTPILDEEGNILHVLCVSRDISERKSYESELKKMAFYDYLTGAPNRRLFTERLEQTILSSKKSQQHFSVMIMDFDRFKWVNDNLGHDVGDELLVQFVQRVKSCLRNVDTIARLGGDEFAILIPETSSVKAVEKIAMRILKALQEPWHIFGHKFITTSSIGICISSCGGYERHSLMKHADNALYKAKRSGRNTYQICQNTSDQFDKTDSVEKFEQDIKQAIANSEFYLVYQPKFNLSTKKIVSIEALIRWEHPVKGLILPDKFISRAEQLNLIEPITRWVLHNAANEAKRWENNYGKRIPVAVNISPQHFENETIIITDVMEVIQKTGINPQNLILEITETAMIHEMENTINTIKQFKEMGVKIAIDDFGTGYSSLSYLMKLEVDILKLDKTFVQELTSKKNASLVSSIVSLAHNLNLDVVAEGIETEQQYHILNQYGCDIGQGYYFSRPLTVQQLTKEFLQKNS